MNEDEKNLPHHMQFESYQKAFGEKKKHNTLRWLSAIMLVLLLLLLLPWTQNVEGTGLVTTRSPEQRPQELNAVISGRIENWWVKEGDLVKKGDTILQITEVKENYLDPALLKRTDEQLKAKESAVDFYRFKTAAIQNQLQALYDTRELKLAQLKNKIQQAVLYVQSDSMAFEAAKTELKIAQEQFKRQQELYNQGLKSLTELEQRKQALQNAEAKRIIAENKFINAKNDWLNAKIELNQVNREFSEKISKAESEKYTALSEINTGEGDVAKLKNQFSNYAIRNAFYYITAPQSGQITRTVKAGLGEVVKEGELLVKIVPSYFDYAVEMYVSTFDLPLISLGQKVRFQFDGWPVIVFSGWQNISYGTFGGTVAAIDNSISDNGKFRILVAEDKNDVPWPRALKVGGGARGMALLKDVPVYYELWRRLNGFPPDYYSAQKPQTKNEKK